MANGGEKNNDFYAVLGLNKECTPTELRTAYKKLAMGNGEESFEELQELFEEMFQVDIDSFGSSDQSATSSSASSPFASYGESSGSNKRNSYEMSSGDTKLESSSSFDAQFHSFCLGTGGTQARYQATERSQRRRNGRSSRR